jgi:ferredoxin-NADP reductase
MQSAEAEFQLEVLDREQVADDVIALTLGRLDGQPLPAWSPGAHIDLVLREDLVRQYSLCGALAADSWRVGILRERSGRGGSVHAHEELRRGSTVRVRGPRNHFEFLPAEKYIFIAGGIGITPLLPMINAVGAAAWRLSYGGRSISTMAFLGELAILADHVDIRPQDEHGLLDLQAILSSATEGTRIYCCGPELLIEAVEALHAASPIGTLHVERFAATAPEVGDSIAFDVLVHSSNVTVRVEPGQSILRAVDAAGVSVMFSCEEGTCGTCETRVLAGVPEHRDSVLTEQERAANDTMMICVSRSKTDSLSLDL